MEDQVAQLHSLQWQCVAGGIFVVAYALIASEKIHKTKVALAGAALMLVLRIVTQHEAFTETEVGGISWNTIFLLAGMMIIVSIVRRTGVFTAMAIWAAKLGRGRPFAIAALLSVATAVLSAFLDNVTTVLLMAPVTIAVAARLQINPVPFLICEIVASNIGGTATLIGDPPNILIGSAAGLGFMSFVTNLAPVVIVVLAAMVVTVRWMFGREWSNAPDAYDRLKEMDARAAITDWGLLRTSGTVTLATLGGFVVHSQLGLEPATIALAGAALLLLLCNQDAHEILTEIEWTTLFFFMGLFIMVTGLVKVGLIELMARGLLHASGGNMNILAPAILWFSGIASAIIDNIPFVATMNPLVIDLAHQMQQSGQLAVPAGANVLHAPEIMALWWSLSLGACLGGNGTIIGASANVVVAGMSERHGFPITFKAYLKYGVPLAVESLIICTVYVYLRYLLPLS